MSFCFTVKCSMIYMGDLYMISLTTDNASVNDVIIEVTGQIILQKYNVPYTPDMHIRCIAHVVNLIVQAFLAAMDEADSPDDIDYFLLHKESPIHYDPDDDEDHIAMESEDVDLEAMDVNGDEVLDIAEEKAIEEIQHSSPLKRVFNLSPDLLVCTYLVHCLAAFYNDQDCILTPAPCQILQAHTQKLCWQSREEGTCSPYGCLGCSNTMELYTCDDSPCAITEGGKHTMGHTYFCLKLSFGIGRQCMGLPIPESSRMYSFTSRLDIVGTAS